MAASSKKEVNVVPNADREPLSEEHCIILEKVMELLLTSVLNPKGFDDLYRLLYPRDIEFDAVLLYVDLCQILQVVAKSRLFRKDIVRYERRITVGHEREVWEMYRKAHRRPMEEDEKIQAELHTFKSIQEYKDHFERMIGLVGEDE